MKNILITGGAGFVGSNLAVKLKTHFDGADVCVLDNLYRKGSECNLPRLENHSIKFINGDVRNYEDLRKAGKIDFLIECSAEPSVLAGQGKDTDYLIQTNLNGAINCAEYCREHNAAMLFLSTSRVYPYKTLANAVVSETETRFEFNKKQAVPGLSQEGVAEDFPMSGPRSLYGATKYAAEVMLEEYRDRFSIPVIINRCGVLSGPWQFGKSDQGIAAFWTAAHMNGRNLKYIGFRGCGKQVRDFLHIDDLFELIKIQMKNPEKFSEAGFFNIGGGRRISASLKELTAICEKVTGRKIEITAEPELRYADIPVYLTDTARIKEFCGWSPQITLEKMIQDINNWINSDPAINAFFK